MTSHLFTVVTLIRSVKKIFQVLCVAGTSAFRPTVSLRNIRPKVFFYICRPHEVATIVDIALT